MTEFKQTIHPHNQTSFPTVYFPTTTLFVDDNISFLHSIPLLLKENMPYFLEDNPIVALNAINNDNLTFNLNNFIAHDINIISDTLTSYMAINFSKLHQIVYDNMRYKHISVVVVDYAMPQINGLEFCAKITNPFVKKIMLTGIADQSIAISAFNQGIIDKFFIKTQCDFNEINTAINHLQRNYFAQKYNPISEILSIPNSDYIFKESDFIALFNQYCSQNNIIEYYLFTENGSTILIDPKGQISYLYVYTTDDLETFYEIAKDNAIDHELLHKIQAKTHIPCFLPNINFLKLPINTWYKYLVNARHFKGIKDYYYAFLQNNNTLYLEKPFLSLNEYMEKINDLDND